MWFEQSSDVDLGRPTVEHDPDDNAVRVTWAGHGLALALNEAEALGLADAIREVLNER